MFLKRSLALLLAVFLGVAFLGCPGDDEETEKKKPPVTGAQVGQAGYAIISASAIDQGGDEKFIRIDVSLANLGKKGYAFSEKNFRLVGKSGEEYTQSDEGNSIGYFPDTLSQAKSVNPRAAKTVTLIYKIPADDASELKLKTVYGDEEALLDVPIQPVAK